MLIAQVSGDLRRRARRFEIYKENKPVRGVVTVFRSLFMSIKRLLNETTRILVGSYTSHSRQRAHTPFHLINRTKLPNRTQLHKLLKGFEALRISSVDPTHSWVAYTTRAWVLSVFFAERSLRGYLLSHLVSFSWHKTKKTGTFLARLAQRRANDAGHEVLLLEARTAVAPQVICNNTLRGCKYLHQLSDCKLRVLYHTGF